MGLLIGAEERGGNRQMLPRSGIDTRQSIHLDRGVLWTIEQT